jgi:hypothetical protein
LGAVSLVTLSSPLYFSVLPSDGVPIFAFILSESFLPITFYYCYYSPPLFFLIPHSSLEL